MNDLLTADAAKLFDELSWPSPDRVSSFMLQLSQVSKRYGDTHAVKGVDLDVAGGARLALVFLPDYGGGAG